MKKYESVREYRLALGMSQAELAQKLQVSLNTISRWENDKRNHPDYLLDHLEFLLNQKEK